MKGFLIVLPCVLGVLCMALYQQFGTIEPCGILRAEVRNAAVREGGIGLLASALPDSVMDGLLIAQYGPLSPGRCISLALSAAQPPAPAPQPQQTQMQPRPWQPPPAPQQVAKPPPVNRAVLRQQAKAEADAAVQECRQRRLSGELPSFVASAQCSSPNVIKAYQRIDYGYMDLVYSLVAKRMEISRALDAGRLTESQASLELNTFVANLNAQERQRDIGN